MELPPHVPGQPGPPTTVSINPRPLRRLRGSYLIALALIAVMTLVSHGVVSAMLTQQRADATVINVAGRQRMLSQRMSKAAVALSTLSDDPRSHAAFLAELEAAHDLWIQSHHALQDGDPALGLPALENAAMRRSFVELDRPFALMDAATRGILSSAGDPDASAALDANVSKLLAHQSAFLTQQNDIVNAFENLARAKVHRLERAQWWLLVATLMALIAEALLVFEPARRAMRRQIKQLAEVNEIMSWQARHDILTGLPNRGTLMQELDRCVNAQKTEITKRFAVYFMDFDGFKAINDGLGHDAGDRLLCNIANRIGELHPDTDGARLTGYRLGGDEFVLLLEGENAHVHARTFAEATLETFALPHRVGRYELSCTASVGVALSDRPELKAVALLRDADMAMIHAKEAGKGRYVLFDRSMYELAQRQHRIETELKLAVERNALQLRYQIIVGANGEADAVEALLHWDHPELGLVPNEELLQIAERSDLIHAVGQWVLTRVATDGDRWGSDPNLAGLRIHVNVSRPELLHPDFSGRVRRLLIDHPGLRNRLCLECPQSVLHRGADAFALLARSLSDEGVKFGIDRLDSLNTPLNLLATLPISFVKIGMNGPVDGNQDTLNDALQVSSSLAAFAHHRGIQVIGTGIETSAQAAAASALNADAQQGRHLEAPGSCDTVAGSVNGRGGKDTAAA